MGKKGSKHDGNATITNPFEVLQTSYLKLRNFYQSMNISFICDIHMEHQDQFIPTPDDCVIAVSVQSSAAHAISQLQNFKTRNCAGIQS